jgi:hypothetical protein
MTHSASDSMVVLANLATGRCRGGSCACPGTTLRLVALGLLSDWRSYIDSRAWLMGNQKLHSGWHGDVLSA